MPVYRLLEEMTYEEFCGWMCYFERRPVDWRADSRAFKILQTQGVKHKPQEVFESLGPIHNPPSPEGFDVQGFKRSGLFSKLSLAVDGDKLEL